MPLRETNEERELRETQEKLEQRRRDAMQTGDMTADDKPRPAMARGAVDLHAKEHIRRILAQLQRQSEAPDTPASRKRRERIARTKR